MVSITKLVGHSGVVWLCMCATGWAENAGVSLSVDVAADCNAFAFTGPLATSGEGPGFGATFMQEGVIYPGGTFEQQCPEAKGCGLDADGNPEFEPIGTWRCWGTFVAEGIDTESGVWLVSTQIYDFDDAAPGAQTLTSVGNERVDENVPFLRAITGGTGRFDHARGEVQQTKVGFNATECENFTFAFDVRPGRQP